MIMALEKQIQIYCPDTRNFYSRNEERIHALNQKVRYERKNLLDDVKKIETSLMKEYKFTEDDIKALSKGNYQEGDNQSVIDLLEIYMAKKEQIAHKAEVAKRTKSKLQKLFENKVQANIDSDGKHHTRVLKNNFDTENPENIISVFDSSFTRMIDAKPDTLSEDFMVIQVYYFDVIKDLIYHGFMYKGEKYIYFTSSAGQIRTKKCVFIKESIWNKHEKTIMCGLTMAAINAKGGNNPNKHLAYMALNNSATDVWEEFDIDKAIVIDDFETKVFGTYDYIDAEDYSITRKQGEIPITHTDGAGMMLPCMGKNRQVRLPWIKGLLGVFDFVKFIQEHNYYPIIKDIYGVEHDVIAEGIQIIFTKSQFKMWKYYDSWEQYKEYYKKYGCTAAYANVESDKSKNATINYQMLQSLTDITDEEIAAIAEKSVTQIANICDSVENVKSALGISVYNELSPLQKSIRLYPNLLSDPFITSQLKDIKDSWVKSAKSGKLRIKGKYSFVLPDFYAACEYWFGGIENPDGLLADGEVFCWLSRKYRKVDCLRSPHLYREHAVRINIACNDFEDRQKKLREWYCTDAIYTSCHDFISKILQFDVDGDTLLVVNDETLVRVAERNMKGIVPLYYDMKKAASIPLTNASIWQGLNASFSGKSIGGYSNSISKIWNSEVFISGTDEEKQEALDVIKLLCAENNWCIDAAKTLYMPERPKVIDKKIKKFTVSKLPAFFRYAKDKLDEQTDSVNGSFVNKLDAIVPNPRITMKKLGIEKPEYTLLMKNPQIKCRYKYEKGKLVEEKTDPLILAYHELLAENSLKYVSISRMEDTLESKKNEMSSEAYINYKYAAAIKEIRERLSVYGYSETEVADILVKYLYGRKSQYKGMLWLCYGEYFYKNLEKNLKEKPVIIDKNIRHLSKIDKVAMMPQKQQEEYRSDMEKVDEYMKKYTREQNRIVKGKCLKKEVPVKCICCGGDTFNLIAVDKKCPKCIAEEIQHMWDKKIQMYAAKKSSVSNTKEIQCVDCGEWFEVGKFNSATCRCKECQKERRKEQNRLKMQKYRKQKAM